jgi:hypothetical protein
VNRSLLIRWLLAVSSTACCVFVIIYSAPRWACVLAGFSAALYIRHFGAMLPPKGKQEGDET